MKKLRRFFLRFAAVLLCLCIMASADAQVPVPKSDKEPKLKKSKRIFYGLASFYHNKFHGRKSANGETFSQKKLTAACNVLPLGTWIQVTNLNNGRVVVVKTTDRLHPRMKRIVDLSRAAAEKLGYISRGLTRVKIEVLNQKLYTK